MASVPDWKKLVAQMASAKGFRPLPFASLSVVSGRVWEVSAAAGRNELWRQPKALELAESLLGLDCETNGDLGRSIEDFDEMVAKQATEFALGPAPAIQLQSAIAGMAIGTDHIRISHGSNMDSRRSFSSQDTVTIH
jgi:hypothetical protein